MKCSKTKIFQALFSSIQNHTSSSYSYLFGYWVTYIKACEYSNIKGFTNTQSLWAAFWNGAIPSVKNAAKLRDAFFEATLLGTENAILTEAMDYKIKRYCNVAEALKAFERYPFQHEVRLKQLNQAKERRIAELLSQRMSKIA